MDNNGTINLKNIRKPVPPEVAHVPISVPPPVNHAPVAVVTPPPAPAVTPPARPSYASLPPKRRLKIDWTFWGVRAAIGAGVLLVVFLIGYYVYAHIWTRSPFGPTPGTPEQTDSQGADSQAAASATATSSLTVDQIISRVGKLMLLPQGETPTLAGVSDTSALSDQTFFKNAKVGDVVLMYGAARRAILYDPVANLIIEVAPITDATSTKPI